MPLVYLLSLYISLSLPTQAMIEMGLHFAGDKSRHGPARQPDMDRAQAFFSRVRAYNIDKCKWAWHPVLRTYLALGADNAKADEKKFQKRQNDRRLGKIV
jgi:hypothetical protein